MKIEITDRAVVLCDSLPCDSYETASLACGSCPIQAIISKAIVSDPVTYLTEYIN